MDPEIQNCLIQLDNCLQLLLPTPDNFDITDICHVSSKHPKVGTGVGPDADVEKDGTDVEKGGSDVEKHVPDVKKNDADVEKQVVGVEKDDTGVEKLGAGEVQDEGQVGDGDFVRGHGLGSFNYSIQVCVNNVELTETEDNVDLLDTLQDTMRLVTGKFLPVTRHWLEVSFTLHSLLAGGKFHPSLATGWR